MVLGKNSDSLYLKRLKTGIIISLSLTILLLQIWKRIPRKSYKEFRHSLETLVVYDVPQTMQGRPGSILRRPEMPQIPIPSEDEYLPEDETIETTEFTTELRTPHLGEGLGDESKGGSGVYLTRPIKEVIPAYPKQAKNAEGIVELDILVNYTGLVDSVKVCRNTTGSSILERETILAAYKTQYLPMPREREKKSSWIRRLYSFERK